MKQTEASSPEKGFVNNSPWLYQLRRIRPVSHLQYDLETDLAIVGAGIAGVATAYFALKHTNLNITLVEAGKVAHGATGHNAGQLVSYFERPFSELVSEFGLEMAAAGQRDVESAWVLLDEIFQDTQLRTPIHQFTGYAAGRDIEEILVHIKNNQFRLKAKLSPQLIMVAEEAPEAKSIPARYNSLFAYMPHKDILALLETDDTRYIAALPGRKGVMNSALFCEELVGYLLAKYPSRLTLAEHTPVNQLTLEANQAVLTSDKHVITAKKVVLCTNGFERITILNKAGKQVNARFHQLVHGFVGFMAAYLDKMDKPPTAISYLPQLKKTKSPFETEPYFYVTRRPFELEEHGHQHNLICVGGPEALMDDVNGYRMDRPYPEQAQKQIDEFLHTVYLPSKGKQIEYKFKWHGLMGYTPSGVRVIGPDPVNPVLHYNLGCNGVGLLHSIYGGLKISQFLRGEKLAPSIFDARAE